MQKKRVLSIFVSYKNSEDVTLVYVLLLRISKYLKNVDEAKKLTLFCQGGKTN